jgi:hypothetical protein
MGMTRETYTKQGRKCAEGGGPPVTTLRPGTWQYKAFMDGYNFVALRSLAYREPGKSYAHLMPGVPPQAGLNRRFLMYVDRWPPSAREHVRNLILDMRKERRPDRLKRLALAVERMAARHDPRPPAETMKVWIDDACTVDPQAWNALGTHQNDPPDTKGNKHGQ